AVVASVAGGHAIVEAGARPPDQMQAALGRVDVYDPASWSLQGMVRPRGYAGVDQLSTGTGGERKRSRSHRTYWKTQRTPKVPRLVAWAVTARASRPLCRAGSAVARRAHPRGQEVLPGPPSHSPVRGQVRASP